MGIKGNIEDKYRVPMNIPHHNYNNDCDKRSRRIDFNSRSKISTVSLFT